MQNEQRAQGIEKEMNKLKNELKALKGNTYLNLKNADKLTYPLVLEHINYETSEIVKSEIVERFLGHEKLSYVVRMILTPESKRDPLQPARRATSPKRIKDMSMAEYDAIRSCIDECIEVIGKYGKELHPKGIAVGEYEDEQSLFL